MKKFLMITTAVYGLSLFAPAISQAQTCKPAPDCADMGYDKSVDDCAGKKMLKCPFNTNFVTCEDGGWDGLSIFDLAWEELRTIYVDESDYFVAKSYSYYDGYEFTFPEDGCILNFGSMGHYTLINNVELSTVVYGETLLCFKKGTTFWRSSFANASTNKGSLAFVPAKSSLKPLSECEVGDFYLSNNKCSKNPITNVSIKTKGVIADTENKLMFIKRGLEPMAWSYASDKDTLLPNFSSINEAILDFKGYTYFSYKNLNQGLVYGSPISSCLYVSLGGNDGSFDDSFLPSAGHLNKIIPNYDTIVSSLSKLGISFQSVWTGTEYDAGKMWMFNAQTKQFEAQPKRNEYAVICMRYYDEAPSGADPCYRYDIAEQTPRVDVCSYDSCITGSSTYYKLISCNCSSYYPSPDYYCEYAGGTTCPTDKTLCSTNCCPYTCDEVTCNNLGGWYVDGHCSEEC